MLCTGVMNIGFEINILSRFDPAILTCNGVSDRDTRVPGSYPNISGDIRSKSKGYLSTQKSLYNKENEDWFFHSKRLLFV